MVRRVALIVALAVLLAALQVVHVRSVFGDGPSPVFEVEVTDGEVVVGDVPAAGGFASLERFHRAGLRKGDVIEAAYAGDRGGRIDGLLVLIEVVRRAGRSETITLHVRRPSERGRRFEIVIPPRAESQGTTLFLFLGWTVFVPLAALTAALLLGLLKPEDTRAFVGSLMFLSLAGALTMDALTVPPGWAYMAVGAQMVSSFGADLLFLWFFLIFPTPSLIDRRLPWLKYAALACTAAVAALSVAGMWTALASLAAFERYWGDLDCVWLSLAINGFASSLVLIGLVSLVLNTRRLRSRDERRRMLIILVGTLVGLGPLFIVQVYYGVQDRAVPLPVGALVVILLSLFPISFVYAVVRHRVLGIRLILRRRAVRARLGGVPPAAGRRCVCPFRGRAGDERHADHARPGGRRGHCRGRGVRRGPRVQVRQPARHVEHRPPVLPRRLRRAGRAVLDESLDSTAAPRPGSPAQRGLGRRQRRPPSPDGGDLPPSGR